MICGCRGQVAGKQVAIEWKRGKSKADGVKEAFEAALGVELQPSTTNAFSPHYLSYTISPIGWDFSFLQQTFTLLPGSD